MMKDQSQNEAVIRSVQFPREFQATFFMIRDGGTAGFFNRINIEHGRQSIASAETHSLGKEVLSFVTPGWDNSEAD